MSKKRFLFEVLKLKSSVHACHITCRTLNYRLFWSLVWIVTNLVCHNGHIDMTRFEYFNNLFQQFFIIFFGIIGFKGRIWKIFFWCHVNIPVIITSHDSVGRISARFKLICIYLRTWYQLIDFWFLSCFCPCLTIGLTIFLFTNQKKGNNLNNQPE